MILKSVRIQNYRSVKDATLHCDSLTALVGANGSGKSSFLRAIDLFDSEKPNLSKEDYYDGQTDDPIRITATFKNLSDSAMDEFADYVLEGELVVTNVLEWNNGKPKSSYRGTRPQNPDFALIREDDTKDAKRKYEDLRQKGAYKDDLPKCATKDAVREALRQWEKNNPGKCERRPADEKEFKRVGGFPKRFVQILYVPPVRDAAEDAQESRNSALSKLMDLAVNNSLATDDKLVAFKEGAQKEYDDLMRTTGQKNLKDLGKRMSKTVSIFAPGTKVSLSWGSTDLFMESKAEIRLEEDGYASTVDGAGHGLQRILIMSMLQHLAEQTAGADENSDESPALVILLDEPELYQHPNRQRHMSDVLRSLAGRKTGTIREMQIIYSTHSPHFVRIDHLDRVRIVRKVAGKPRRPRVSRTSSTSLVDVAHSLTKIPDHGTETAQDLEHSLKTIMTPMMNEGFFADVVVLVEGPADREALLAVAKSMDSPLESLGISVIPCGSKNSLSRPAMIFKKLKIPLYMVWDEDSDSQGSTLNRVLLSVIGKQTADPVTGVYGTHACLESKLDDVIKNDLGNKFDEYAQICRNDLRLPNDKAVIKKPHAVPYLIEIATGDDIRFPTIEKIVRSIIKLCPARAPARSRRA